LYLLCVPLSAASTSAIEAEMENRVTQLVETLTAELKSAAMTSASPNHRLCLCLNLLSPSSSPAPLSPRSV
jgi:hypothetical protein